MTFVRDNPHLRPHAAEGRLLRIDRGAYLHPAAFYPGMEPWELDRAITLARAHALSRRVRVPSDSPDRLAPILTGEAALIATGAEVWNQNPPITYRDDVQTRNRKPFPAVVFDGHTVAARSAIIVGSSKSLRLDAQNHQGLILADLDTLVWDLANTLHAQAAYANLSVLLGQVVGFSNFTPESSREAETDLKLQLIANLSLRRGQRGIRKAQSLIRLANAGAGSVMEAAFVWMLHCWIRPRIPWETQHKEILDGQLYFADGAVPQKKLSLEFDGVEKLGSNPDTQAQRARAFYERSAAFLRHGWSTVSVTSAQMRNLSATLWSLGRDLESFGITRKAPGGPLWEDLP